jgi:hypothetical protein
LKRPAASNSSTRHQSRIIITHTTNQPRSTKQHHSTTQLSLQKALLLTCLSTISSPPGTEQSKNTTSLHAAAAMSGEIIKADKDFTKEVDAALPEAEKQAQNGQVQAAVEKLLALEKQTRQSSDLASTSRVIVAIVTICKDSGDWSLLNEQVQVLSKKHGQLKQAITKMVQVVMGFLDDAPSLDVKLSVIETLRTVTEGKVWLRNVR